MEEDQYELYFEIQLQFCQHLIETVHGFLPLVIKLLIMHVLLTVKINKIFSQSRNEKKK